MFSAYAEGYCHLFRLPAVKLRELLQFYKRASEGLQSRLDNLPSRALRKISLTSVCYDDPPTSATQSSLFPNSEGGAGSAFQLPGKDYDSSVKHRITPFPPPTRASVAAIVAARYIISTSFFNYFNFLYNFNFIFLYTFRF